MIECNQPTHSAHSQPNTANIVVSRSYSWLTWTRVGGTNERTQCNSFYHLRSIEFHWFIIHWFDSLQQWAMCCAYETISFTLFPIRWRVLHSTVSTPMSCIHANDHFHPLRNAFVHGYSPFHLHFNRIVWQIESLGVAVRVGQQNNILIHDPWTIFSRFSPLYCGIAISILIRQKMFCLRSVAFG